MKSIRHPRTARDPLLHIETDGCIVNIQVGLTDADGRHVTRVGISPDDESRGGDGTGHIWYRDGSRIIRLEPGQARPMRINFTITGGGESLADVEDAVLEALERIKNGNVLGFDRNETGSFHFEVEGQEEETRAFDEEITATVLVREADREAVEQAMAEAGEPYPGLRTTHPYGMWVADGLRAGTRHGQTTHGHQSKDVCAAELAELIAGEAGAMAICECYLNCAEDPATGCSLSGIEHVHAGERCPIHPDAPGDH